MRTITLLGAAALLAGAAPAAAERWFRVSGNDESVAYVDADSISVRDDKRYALSYHVYARPLDDRLYASSIRAEFDCAGNWFRTLEYSYFGANNQHMGTEPSETIDMRRTPDPGSINEDIFRYVCTGAGGVAVDDAWRDAATFFAQDAV